MNKSRKNNRKSKGQKNTGGRQLIQRQIQPPAIVITLPYTGAWSMTEAGAGLGNAYSMSVNSAFDIDFSGGGLQPIGYDQYSAFYGRYRVVGVRFKLDIANTGTLPITAGFYNSAQSTLPATALSWFAQNDTAKYKLLGTNTGSNAVASFRGTVNLPRVLGVTSKEYMSEMDFAAIITNSPVRLAYQHFWIRGGGGVATAIAYATYWLDIEFSQPVALSLS